MASMASIVWNILVLQLGLEAISSGGNFSHLIPLSALRKMGNMKIILRILFGCKVSSIVVVAVPQLVRS